ncbi:hypothetical protein H696_02570 [Fonticula alba]|uniref:Uncharacterized protein n=1 Tax=Fonticula alba TaxID=691883 RepID=A0A058Z7I3_FONAL|nr:hypothetical protein H696_02570 [Fonticula alba]KCV70240.1 hypothetical protein H696_02570 [Fonticula alba]|eukprot:XP_009494756.1 hypothetical protein H696_02570 [Fonticula alba]
MALMTLAWTAGSLYLLTLDRNGYVENSYSWMAPIAISVSYGYRVFLLIALALGWGVSRPDLSSPEWKGSVIPPAIFAGLMVLLISPGFNFLTYFVVFLLARFMNTYSMETLSHLRRMALRIQVLITARDAATPIQAVYYLRAVALKFNALSRLRMMTQVYIFLLVLAVLIGRLFFPFSQWLAVPLGGAVEALVGLFLFWVLRLGQAYPSELFVHRRRVPLLGGRQSSSGRAGPAATTTTGSSGARGSAESPLLSPMEYDDDMVVDLERMQMNPDLASSSGAPRESLSSQHSGPAAAGVRTGTGDHPARPAAPLHRLSYAAVFDPTGFSFDEEPDARMEALLERMHVSSASVRSFIRPPPRGLTATELEERRQWRLTHGLWEDEDAEFGWQGSGDMSSDAVLDPTRESEQRRQWRRSHGVWTEAESASLAQAQVIVLPFPPASIPCPSVGGSLCSPDPSTGAGLGGPGLGDVGEDEAAAAAAGASSEKEPWLVCAVPEPPPPHLY